MSVVWGVYCNMCCLYDQVSLIAEAANSQLPHSLSLSGTHVLANTPLLTRDSAVATMTGVGLSASYNNIIYYLGADAATKL